MFQGLTFFITINHHLASRLNKLYVCSPSFGHLNPYFEVLSGLLHGGGFLALTSYIAFSYLLLMILAQFYSLIPFQPCFHYAKQTILPQEINLECPRNPSPNSSSWPQLARISAWGYLQRVDLLSLIREHFTEILHFFQSSHSKYYIPVSLLLIYF